MSSLSIITGFLGSGKTTLLNRLLQREDMARTAVLINELGEVGIDNLIVEQFDDDVVLLESGCVCCSVRDDLSVSLLDLHTRSQRGAIPEFDRAVLETTGIADPAAILQLLMADRDVCERYRYSSVITVVDALYGPDNLRALPEVSRQILMADRLVLAKQDLVDTAAALALRAKLAELNPLAPCFDNNTVTPAELFATDVANDVRVPVAATDHGNRFTTFHIGWQQAVDWTAIETWAEGLLAARGDDIYRIKGILNLTDEPRPTVFQSVQHSVYARDYLEAWPNGTPRNDLVFIVQNFTRPAALASLEPFVHVPLVQVPVMEAPAADTRVE